MEPEHQEIIVNWKQTSQVKEFSTFLCIGRCNGLGSLKSAPSYASQLSGASILCCHILASSRLPVGSGCSLMAPGSCRSSSWMPWRAEIADDCDFLIYWYGGKCSISHSEQSLFWSAVYMLWNQTWVQLPSGSKVNLLILGCGEGKCSIYCKALAEESVIISELSSEFQQSIF